MTKLKTSIAVLAGLVLIFSPILQMDTAQASMTSSSSDLCGESTCCCCPVDFPTAGKQSSGDSCQCRISQSNEPYDVEMNSNEERSVRDISVGYAAAIARGYVPEGVENRVKLSVTHDAGKSPPVYLFSCAFLI